MTVEKTSMPGLQHVADVLVALGMLEAGRVGVRELVDQAQLGRAGEDAGEVHLLQVHAAIAHAPQRELLEPGQLPLGLGPPVGLDQADDDVAPGLGLRLGLREHPVGLADAGGHAEEDAVAAGHRRLSVA